MIVKANLAGFSFVLQLLFLDAIDLVVVDFSTLNRASNSLPSFKMIAF